VQDKILTVHMTGQVKCSLYAVRTYTGRETSAHKQTWSAHKIMFLPKCFCTYFIHVIPNSDEFR